MDDETIITWTVDEIVVTILIALLLPIIFAGNILVILAVIRFQRLQLPTNYFLVSLAIADISIGASMPLSITRESYKQQIISDFLCLAPHCLTMTFCGASILCLSAIAYDRFTVLSKSLHYSKIITVKKVVIFSVVSWMYAIVMAWSPFFDWHNNIDIPTQYCSFHLIKKEALILLLFTVFLPPYVVIFYCYWHIYRIARNHSIAIAAQEMSLAQQYHMHCMVKDTKYAKTVGIVIGFYLALWLPYQLCIFIDIATEIKIPERLVNYLALLSYCNSAINPWIYAFKNKDFTVAFKKLLWPVRRLCMCNEAPSSGSENTSVSKSDIVSVVANN